MRKRETHQARKLWDENEIEFSSSSEKVVTGVLMFPLLTFLSFIQLHFWPSFAALRVFIFYFGIRSFVDSSNIQNTATFLSSEALAAQKEVAAYNGTRNTWFCGAWMRHGFHEDGLASALNVVDAIQSAPAMPIAAE